MESFFLFFGAPKEPLPPEVGAVLLRVNLLITQPAFA